MKITKNKDHYLFTENDQSYHMSFEDYNQLGELKAIEYVKIEMKSKLNEFNSSSINFKQARELGFCEYGIEDFCNKLNLDINKTYKIKHLHSICTIELAFKYFNETLKLFGKQFFIDNEKVISKDAYYSHCYVNYVLKNKFPLGEKAISKDAQYSHYYAKDVLKNKFPLGEEAISKNACYSYIYALNILNNKFPLGENAISKNAQYSYWYAKDVLKNKFPLGEKVISKDAYYFMLYNDFIVAL